MRTDKWSVQKMILTAMLAAVSGVLMSLEFALPMMPPFYKVDFSDVPSLIAVFLLGPLSGFAVEVLKLVIKLVTVGTNTMYVGEVANLISTMLYIFPLYFIYKRLGSTRRSAVIGMTASIVIRTACACAVNAFVTLPLYAAAMGVSLDQVVQMVASVNPAIRDLNGFIVMATVPFNIIKIGLNYVIGYLIYSRLLAAKIVADVKTV